LAAFAGVAALARGTSEDGTRVVREAPLAFNLRHPDSMREVRPRAGEWLRLEREGLDSFAVMPLRLPAYEGDVGGILPVQASRELEGLRERFPELEPVEEGKARVNQVAGYSMVFRISRRPRQYGRLVLLPQPVERSGDEPEGRGSGAVDGVKLLLIANPDAGADKARDVGTRGELKIPYRSFRFGTEGP
jgi:hypothetical protein